MGHPKNLAGKIFGRLTAISLEPQIVVVDTMGRHYTKPRKWLCRCGCGKETKVRVDRLLEGKTRSCGCLRDDIAGAVGDSRNRLVEQSAQTRKAIVTLQTDEKRLLTPVAPKKGADLHHGLPRGTYDALFDAQGGRCFICQEAPPAGSRLHLDHDHATQQVRGLLCNGCNSGLGLFKDNLISLARAMHYLSIERPMLLSKRTEKGQRVSPERRKARDDQFAAWEKARAEKAAVREEKRKAKAAAQEARRIEREAKKQAAEAKRQAVYAEREQFFANKKREWEKIEQERVALRAAKQKIRRAKREAEKERVKAQMIVNDLRWGNEFEPRIPEIEYAPAQPVGFGAVE